MARVASALDAVLGRSGHAGGLANLAERVDCLAASFANLDASSQEALLRERVAREASERSLLGRLQQERRERARSCDQLGAELRSELLLGSSALRPAGRPTAEPCSRSRLAAAHVTPPLPGGVPRPCIVTPPTPTPLLLATMRRTRTASPTARFGRSPTGAVPSSPPPPSHRVTRCMPSAEPSPLGPHHGPLMAAGGGGSEWATCTSVAQVDIRGPAATGARACLERAVRAGDGVVTMDGTSTASWTEGPSLMARGPGGGGGGGLLCRA